MKFRISISILILLILGCSESKRSDIPQKSTFVDERDGRIYNTVRIGDQIWMAENLDYGTTVKDCNQEDNEVVEKTLYNNDTENGSIYGAMYTWNEAMNWGRAEHGQDICPEGWHIPTLREWQELIEYVGADTAGQALKASKSDSIAWDGSNTYGFSAIPSGVAYKNYFGRKGHWAVYWTATEYDSSYAWFAQLDGFWYPEPPKYKILYLGNYYLKDNAFCIRCIKDGIK